MPPTLTLDEYVQVNSVIFASDAFECPDLSPLWGKGPNRGQSRLIPKATGQLARKRRTDEWHVDPIKLFIYGYALYDGTPSSDARVTLRQNLDYLIANVFTPSTTGNGTWPMALHVGAGTYTGDCYAGMTGPTPFSPAILLCSLDLVIPSGELVLGS